MLKRIVMLAAAVTLIFPAGALAYFQAGDWEFTISGSGESDRELRSNVFTLGAGLGYFFTPGWEGVIRQDLTVLDPEPGGTDWRFATAVGLDYHFDLRNWRPFLGASVGYRYGDVEEVWFAGPEAGIKAFITETSFFQLLVQYQIFFESVDDIDDNFDIGRFAYGVGIGTRW